MVSGAVVVVAVVSATVVAVGSGRGAGSGGAVGGGATVGSVTAMPGSSVVGVGEMVSSSSVPLRMIDVAHAAATADTIATATITRANVGFRRRGPGGGVWRIGAGMGTVGGSGRSSAPHPPQKRAPGTTGVLQRAQTGGGVDGWFISADPFGSRVLLADRGSGSSGVGGGEHRL